jgi:uncharacterized protein with HEPN domain
VRDDRERLLDILEAIEKIESRLPGDEPTFNADELVQTWVIHHLRIIGEAVRGLSDDFRLGHPSLPYKSIIGMRNILTHSYFDIDVDIVWSVLISDLPALKATVALILQNEYPSPR